MIDIEPNTAKTRYLGMDGTGIPMRAEETAGRCGKQPDGTAKTREVKLVASWTAETLKGRQGGHRQRLGHLQRCD